jgi:hypothetical protein
MLCDGWGAICRDTSFVTGLTNGVAVEDWDQIPVVQCVTALAIQENDMSLSCTQVPLHWWRTASSLLCFRSRIFSVTGPRQNWTLRTCLRFSQIGGRLGRLGPASVLAKNRREIERNRVVQCQKVLVLVNRNKIMGSHGRIIQKSPHQRDQTNADSCPPRAHMR